MNGLLYMNKIKYIVVKIAEKEYLVGRCMVGHEDTYVTIASTVQESQAKLVMDALAEYELSHE
jgi:hypothetical protein